MLIFMFFLKLH